MLDELDNVSVYITSDGQISLHFEQEGREVAYIDLPIEDAIDLDHMIVESIGRLHERKCLQHLKESTSSVVNIYDNGLVK